MNLHIATPLSRDPLTLLPLRADFDADLALALVEAQAQSGSVSVAVLDVDLFGQINAARGRAVADARASLRHEAAELVS